MDNIINDIFNGVRLPRHKRYYNISDQYVLEILLKKYPEEIAFVNPKLKFYKELALMVVSECGQYLHAVNRSFKGDRDIVLAAVKNHGRAIKYANPKFRKDEEVVLTALRNYILAINYADISLRRSFSFMLEAVTINGLTLRHSAKLNFYCEIVEAAIRSAPFAIHFVNRYCWLDSNFVKFALEQKCFVNPTNVPKKWHYLVPGFHGLLKNVFDREIILAAVEFNGVNLHHIPEIFRSDKEIVLAAVKNYGYSLTYASESLKEDREVVLAAVKNYARAFEMADESFQSDEEIVRLAVLNHGKHIQRANLPPSEYKKLVIDSVITHSYQYRSEYLSDTMKKDRDVVLTHVSSHPDALKEIDLSLRYDREVVMAAVKVSGISLECVKDVYGSDREVVLTAIKTYPEAANFSTLEDFHNIHRWCFYYHENYIRSSYLCYRLLRSPSYAKKYFNVIKYGNMIKFQPMGEQSDIRFVYSE